MQDDCNKNLRDVVKAFYKDTELKEEELLELKNILREIIINVDTIQAVDPPSPR